jgi:cobalt-zinc-cadmium efflux system membrane fusion protein
MNPFRIPPAALGPALAVLVLTLSGCGKPSGESAAHEERAPAGPHGGALVILDDAAIRSAGIAVDSVGAGTIELTAELPGEIKLDAERSVEVRPTYAGRVRDLRAGLGARVERGEALATLLSNESLGEYTIEAPMSGTVIARPVNPGASVDHETVLYRIADLGTVWLDFPIYPQHLGRIRAGQRVRIRTEGGDPQSVTATVRYVGPMIDVDTRTTFGRVVLANADGHWQPGRLATAVVSLEKVRIAMAVPEEAIVRMGTGSAVFRADSGRFEVQPITVGRSDGRTTEVLTGLEPGARIVVRNAFLLKAELEKEAGGHED